MDIPHIRHLSDVILHYDAILCDVWGVLHNGVHAAPGAAEALERARALGRAVVLVTNAPRPAHVIGAQLRDLGIGPAACDDILSSGEVTRDLMLREGGAPFYHLGPARDDGLFAGLDARAVPLDAAHYILCTGLFDDETEEAGQYRPLLAAARARDLRLFCANPDLVVDRGGRLIPCAGALAALYEEMGGAVVWIGKPRALIYAVARTRLAARLGFVPPPQRILCIGDALRTDIAGAQGMGYASLLILAGIHAHQVGLENQQYDGKALHALAHRNGACPDMTMVSLCW